MDILKELHNACTNLSDTISKIPKSHENYAFRMNAGLAHIHAVYFEMNNNFNKTNDLTTSKEK